MKKFFITSTLGLLSFLAIWSGGLLYFIFNYNQEETPTDIRVDGIVVFTGSSGRINEGINLLEKDKSKFMLVTGVNESSLINTENWIKSKTSMYSCCIELETKAINTVGNAKETIKWVNKYNLKSIRLVTSSYHILRSEIELKKIAPESLIIIKHPIRYSTEKISFQNLVSYLMLISIEYSKFIISLIVLRLGY
ncbi:MAG: hypothetical protein CMM49_08610 [Rhodospirillaceae bacterium]|nr:hypothetical protein [Rhodospirillaceae bacterium]|tara:strand:- start:43 stop:624 length:582 start_codon:yes stop_codon:yes gene_type:complete